jgi:predicted  nucleic acid-binding Zn-ribbon protein
MNNVDKDIEQFEKNLIEINMMKEQISDLSDSLKKIVGEVKDIDEIKSDLNKEITTLNKSTEESDKQLNMN